MPRIVNYALLACLLATTVVARGMTQEPNLGAGPPPLVVASDLDNPPFAFVDESGNPAGRDVRMMERLAQELGRELDWRRMPFEKLLPAVEAEEVDIVCATIGVTEDRAKRVLFTRPYFKTSIAILVRAEDGNELLARRFKDYRVAAGVGTTSETAILKELPGAKHIIENKSGLTSSERLMSHEVDAVAMDRPAAELSAAKSDGALVVLPNALADEDYALVLPLASQLLATQLSDALQKLSKDWADLNREHGLTLRDDD